MNFFSLRTSASSAVKRLLIYSPQRTQRYAEDSIFWVDMLFEYLDYPDIPR
jgi:hypothetical protein